MDAVGKKEVSPSFSEFQPDLGTEDTACLSRCARFLCFRRLLAVKVADFIEGG